MLASMIGPAIAQIWAWALLERFTSGDSSRAADVTPVVSAPRLDPVYRDDAFADQSLQLAAHPDFGEHARHVGAGLRCGIADAYARAREPDARRGRRDRTEADVIARHRDAARNGERIGHQLLQAGHDAVRADAGFGECGDPVRDAAGSHALFERALELSPAAAGQVGERCALRELAG